MKATPRAAVAKVAAAPRLVDGTDERFTGYGVMGLPFATGHYLGLREFGATSVGPAHRSIWHRTPGGRWEIFTNVTPEQSCPRYFGSQAPGEQVPAIDIAWPDDATLDVTMGERLSWRIELADTPATRMMTLMAGAMAPGRLEQRHRPRCHGPDGEGGPRHRTDAAARDDPERARVQGRPTTGLAGGRRARPARWREPG